MAEVDLLPSSEFPGPPPWHFNCRSILIPVTKSWEELIGTPPDYDVEHIGLGEMTREREKALRKDWNGQKYDSDAERAQADNAFDDAMLADPKRRWMVVRDKDKSVIGVSAWKEEYRPGSGIEVRSIAGTKKAHRIMMRDFLEDGKQKKMPVTFRPEHIREEDLRGLGFLTPQQRGMPVNFVLPHGGEEVKRISSKVKQSLGPMKLRRAIKEIPLGTRASMDGQVAASLNYDQWLRTKSKKQQIKALGVAKQKLWAGGKLSLPQLIDQSGRELSLKQLVERSVISQQALDAATKVPKAGIGVVNDPTGFLDATWIEGSEGMWGGGINVTRIVDMSNGDKAIMKWNSEASAALVHQWGITDAASLEVAAHKVDGYLGFDLTPPVTLATRGADKASLMRYVKGDDIKVPTQALGRIVSDLDVQRLEVFDFIIANTDRHDGNYFINTATSRPVAIDNGMGFFSMRGSHKMADFRHVVSSRYKRGGALHGHRLDFDVMNAVTKFKADEVAIRTELGELLSTGELDSMFKRVDMILDSGSLEDALEGVYGVGSRHIQWRNAL